MTRALAQSVTIKLRPKVIDSSLSIPWGKKKKKKKMELEPPPPPPPLEPPSTCPDQSTVSDPTEDDRTESKPSLSQTDILRALEVVERDSSAIAESYGSLFASLRLALSEVPPLFSFSVWMPRKCGKYSVKSTFCLVAEKTREKRGK